MNAPAQVRQSTSARSRRVNATGPTGLRATPCCPAAGLDDSGRIPEKTAILGSGEALGHPPIAGERYRRSGRPQACLCPEIRTGPSYAPISNRSDARVPRQSAASRSPPRANRRTRRASPPAQPGIRTPGLTPDGNRSPGRSSSSHSNSLPCPRVKIQLRPVHWCSSIVTDARWASTGLGPWPLTDANSQRQYLLGLYGTN